MPTTIKVDRQLLIKALEAEQKKETDEFKRAMEKFREAEKAYPAKLAVALEKAAAQARKGNVPKETTSTRRNGNYAEVPVFAGFPEKPARPKENQRRACDLQRQIRMLKMCPDKVVRLNENSEYVRFVCEIGNL